MHVCMKMNYISVFKNDLTTSQKYFIYDVFNHYGIFSIFPQSMYLEFQDTSENASQLKHRNIMLENVIILE